MPVRVTGINEVIRAFREVDKQLAKDFGNDLKKAAEPVVTGSQTRIGRYQGASIKTIRAKRAGARVYVEQSARKVTGKRGDYGSLQLRHLRAALDEKQDEVFDSVEATLNRYAANAGF